MKDKISITIEKSVLKEIDTIIDNIYIKNRSQAIEHLVNNSIGKHRTAIILAGGDEKSQMIGKDFRSTTKIGTQSIIEKAIKKLKDNGFTKIFVIARQNVLTSIFNILKDGSNFGIKVDYVEEKESKGTAQSLRLLNGRINNDFLVVYGDLIFDKVNLEELWNHHIKEKAVATIMMTTSNVPSEKGTLKVEGNTVLEFTQKPKKSDIYLVFSPIFVCSTEIFGFSGSSLEENVFPDLAKKHLLKGHLSSEKEIHIHSKEDVNNIVKN